MKLGLQNTARFYYYPGWHELGTTLEFVFSKRAHDALSADLKVALDDAASAVSVFGLTEYEVANSLAIDRLRNEYSGKVEILQLPTPVLRSLKKLAADVVNEESEKSPMARKVHASYARFQSQFGAWRRVSEGAYHELAAV